jgi:PAS domain S-box-containing protein
MTQIHNGSSLEPARLKSPEIEALLAISEKLGASQELTETFQQIMEILSSRFGMERGTLSLLDPETKELIVRVAHGLTEDEIKRGKYKIGEGITGKVVETGGPVIVPSIGREPLFLDRTRARRNIDREAIAFICVPLKLHDEVVGVLSVDKVRSGADTLESDMRFLTIIASIIAQAVRVHRAFSEIVTLKERTDRIIAGMPNGVIVLDPKGLVQTLNPAAERIFGFQRQEVTGRIFLDVFSKFRNVMNIIDRIYDDPNAAPSYETFIFGAASKPVPVAFTWSVLSDENGQTQGIVVNVQDLTEIKRLEQQSRRNQRLASLGTMAAGITHEIRNPLGCIRGASQLLAREITGEKRLKDYLEVIVKEVDRLDRTVKQLLDFARPSKTEMVKTDIVAVIEEALRLLSANPVKTNYDIIKKLPPSALNIKADPSHLTQVFMNLLLNAIEAMPDGGTLTIAVRDEATLPEAVAQEVTIEITDTGCGMSPQVLEQLFTPFFTTREEGTGLGLALSHRIIQEHGGTIDVNSQEGQGTTFVLSFRRV